MTTMTEIKPAIARRIIHKEIVLLVVEDPRAALESIDGDENVTVLCHGTENSGDLDVWGKCLGGGFRLRIRAS